VLSLFFPVILCIFFILPPLYVCSFMPYLSRFGFSADVLENYNKSPFLASETNNFSDSAGGDHTGDYRTILLFLPSFTLSL
jgi:hypothetical protein